MERNLRNKIHSKFIEILKNKNHNWIFDGEKGFIVVRAKASGIYKRYAIYKPHFKSTTAETDSSLSFGAEFIVDKLFSQYREIEARYALSTIGIDKIMLDDYVNIRKSNIYLLPDIRFIGKDYFDVLFTVDKNGKLNQAL